MGAALVAAGLLVGGFSARAQGSLYAASGTFSALSGPSELLPPGVTQGSLFAGLITLMTGNYSVQPESSGVIFTFPGATIACAFTNASYNSALAYSGLTVDFSASQSGATAMEINAGNAYSAFSFGYSGGTAPDNSLQSLENFLNAGFNPVTPSANSAQLTFYNPITGGASAIATGDLASLSPVPEPSTDFLIALGGLVFAVLARRKFVLAGRPSLAVAINSGSTRHSKARRENPGAQPSNPGAPAQVRLTRSPRPQPPHWTVLLAAATVAGGLTARGQNSGLLTDNAITVSAAALPSAFEAGSPMDVLLNLAGGYSYQQMNGSDLIISFPDATFCLNSENSGIRSEDELHGVTVFYSNNYLGMGEAVFEAQATGPSGVYDFGFSKPTGSTATTTVASMVNFLGDGLAGVINSSLQVDNGQSGVETETLNSLDSIVSIPEPRRIGTFSGLVLLGAALIARRRKTAPWPVA
jgi:hypothetical protein